MVAESEKPFSFDVREAPSSNEVTSDALDLIHTTRSCRNHRTA